MRRPVEPRAPGAAPARRERPWPLWAGPLAALVLLSLLTIGLEIVLPRLGGQGHWGSSAFIKPENLLNVLRQQSFIGVIALGATLVIVLGGIDLSVGSLVAFSAVMGVMALNASIDAGAAPPLAIALAATITVGLGALAGAANGLLITLGRLAPFIATLAGLAAYRSLALTLAHSGSITVHRQAPAFAALGTGGIPLPGTNLAPPGVAAVPLVVPWPAMVFLLTAAAVAVVLHRTRLGRHAVAIGCNERAAAYSAIPVGRVKRIIYALAWALTGVAAWMEASRYGAVDSSQAGAFYELDAIAAVVIGGTMMRGGRGTVLGTVIGVLMLGVIRNMLTLVGVRPELQGLAKGVIIVAAVLLQRSGARPQAWAE